MKKFFRVILILSAVGAIAYLLLLRQAEARQLWHEVLDRVPTPAA